MSTTQPHCCESNNCAGTVYHGWCLNCRFCHKKIVVECLRFKDELRTKQLLYVFGLMDRSQRQDGSYSYVVSAEDPNRTAAFFQMFNVDSPFGITCDACINKFARQQQTDLVNNFETNIANNAVDGKQSTSKVIQNDNMNLTQMLSPKVTISPKPIVMPKEDENGLYTFYVSKADTKASTDSIVAYIMENFKMSTDVFKVFALPSRRKNRITYKAFKLTVFTQEISELLCNTEIWTSDFRVRPFDKARNQRNKPEKQRTEKRQTKTRQNSSNKPKNGHSNNNNNANRSNAKPRNNNQRQVNNHRDRKSHRMPRNVTHRTKGNRNPSHNQHQNPVTLNGFQPQHHQLTQQQQYQPNINYGQFPFWNAAPYHYPPPQMFAHNLMPFQMNQQMYRSF